MRGKTKILVAEDEPNLPFWAAANGSGKAGPVLEGSINDYPSSPGPDPDSILDPLDMSNSLGCDGCYFPVRFIGL
jgi:hypothetical protein